MATFVNDLRLTELATGEGSGTWGTTTNQSLELIGESLGYATQQAFSSDADATTTVADGVSDPARAMYFKVTSAGSLSATRTLTIAPNTISRVMFIENATSGSQSIAISQGSGANVTILTGKTAVVYLDGAGSGAAVVDAMLGVDPGVTDTLTEVLVAGNTSGGTNIELSTTDKVQFRDAAIYINSSADGQLDLIADTEIQIAATTVDLNGNLDISGTATGASSFATAAGGTFTTAAGNDLNIVYPDGRSLFFKEAGTTTLTLDNAQGATFAGKITADAGIDIDNINIDGTTIALSSGDLTLDVAGDIILDADGGDVFLRDAGSEFGRFQGSSQDLLIRNDTQDKDISFVGNDGGVTTTALALDMSAAGAATFSSTITTGGNITIGNTSLSQPILQFLSATNGANTIHFGDGTSADAYKGYINYNHTADRLELVGSGDITLDAAGDINLDADGGDIQLKDAGVATGRLGLENGDLNIASMRQDYDIKFKGMDGNTTPFIALTLDMSAAGAATFNAGVTTTAVITGGSYNVGGTAVIDSGRNLVNMGNVNGAAGIFGSLAVDNFTLNGTTLALSSGDFTLDVASDIILNADGGDWKFQDGTTGILEIQNDGNGNAVLITTTSDKDMRFLGNDNGSTITALTLDMSAAGAATFNSTIAATGATLTASTASIVLAKPDAGNLQFSFDGSNSNIASNSSTATINFQPSSTTRMTLAVGGTLTTFPLADKHAVFNENGVDADFRVESDGNANMLFVDGGNNRVGVGTGTPSTTFDVQGSTLINGDLLIGATDAGNKSITIAGGATGNEEGGEIRLATAADHDGTYDFYRIDVNQDDFRIGRQGQTDFTITSTGTATFNSSVSTPTLSSPDGTSILTLANSGEAQFGRGIVVNEAGLDSDFRVESDGNANMLFVDAGNNVVCVGGTTVETADHFEVISSDATTNLRIRNSNAGATGGQIVFDKSSASPADADVLGIINWIGNDSAGNANQFAQIEAKSADVTNGTEDGTLRFGTTVAGTFRYAMDIIDGTVTIPVLNNGYNFQAFASSSNSFFGVRDDGNDSVILQADRSDGFTGFLYNGHTLALSIGGALSKGSGSFKIDHPLEAKKDTHHLVHSFIEGPQADLIYRGRVTLSGGSAAVNVDTASDMTDGTFVVLCRDVQCFTSNETGWTAVKGVVSGNTLTITAQDNSCTDTISWMVVGERQDPHMKDSLTDWTDSDGKIIVEPAKT